MYVGIVAKIRNGPMLKWRMTHKLSQMEAGKLAGISQSQWGHLECMKFLTASQRTIENVASLVGVEPRDICPPELKNKNIGEQRIAFHDVETARLLRDTQQSRLFLEAPDDALIDKESRERLHEVTYNLLKVLTFREREVMKLRYGLTDEGYTYTLGEVGKMLRVTRERVRQIEMKALERLRKHGRKNLVEFLEGDRS